MDELIVDLVVDPTLKAWIGRADESEGMELHHLGHRLVKSEAVVDQKVRVSGGPLVSDLRCETHLEVPFQGEVRVGGVDLGKVSSPQNALCLGVKS